MAPPPEYDKEPKAPDKTVTNIPSEDSKALYNSVNEHQANSDTKSTNLSGNAEVENNKHVETLDDGQLRALLDEAITYKCPKDREGKSNLFKELLESVEQDEQACEAAWRAGRRRARGAGRRALPHSNSLQDLVAALAAEPAPRRRPPPHAPVSARALHGGSLPSGVDTSFLLSEEPVRGVGAEYVATVRCVNPSPLAERRVSASDAHGPHETEPLNRRSKPAFPMYTARATLEIGSGAGPAGPGRAVTTTTASNQVRTPHPPPGKRTPRGPRPAPPAPHWTHNEQIDKWYRGLEAYRSPLERIGSPIADDLFDHALPRTDAVETDSSSRSPFKTIPKTFINAPLPKSPPADNSHIPLANRHDKTKFSDDTDHDHNLAHDDKETEEARKLYRERVGRDLVIPTLSSLNPQNVRSMSIGRSLPIAELDKVSPNVSTARAAGSKSVKDRHGRKTRHRNNRNSNVNVADKTAPVKPDNKGGQSARPTKTCHDSVGKQIKSPSLHNAPKSSSNSNILPKTNINPEDAREMTEKIEPPTDKPEKDTELVEMVPLKTTSKTDRGNEFSLFIANQQRLLQAIETSNSTECKVKTDNEIKISDNTEPEQKEKENSETSKPVDILHRTECKVKTDNEIKISDNTEPEQKEKENSETSKPVDILHSTECKVKTDNEIKISDNTEPEQKEKENSETSKPVENNAEKLLTDTERSVEESVMDCSEDKELKKESKQVVKIGAVDFKVSSEKSHPADLPKDHSMFLSLYKRLLASPCASDRPVEVKGAESRPALAGLAGLAALAAPDAAAAKPAKKKKDKITARLARKPHNENSTKKKDIIRNALKKLFFDNITQSDSTKLTGTAPASKSDEVDSAIPFSCISSPEEAPRADAAPPAPPDAKTAGGAGPPGAAADSLKRSLDENGNAVPGFGEPPHAVGQQKKQRRKKTSKNETVIKSHHIDGYQGNKDLNEVLRFIESAPERSKHDKKKRSAERRAKPAPRASSLDDLRAPPPPRPAPARPAPAKPERRSWGDERAYRREPEPDLELADFQTVTKKRRARRRVSPDPRPPAPAPRSDRSDSNDDVESVRSLPALPARAPASYADIARTRHNIPDLIESCNFYAEAEGEPAPQPAPRDARAYPALDARARRKPPAPAPPRAPDVVADRRPPVILLAAAARARDLDGVTFGFDVNEQLLGRRAPAALPVRAGRARLRFLPAPAPPDPAHLQQIVDYVGAAWEDTVRCGGKVRYFSE